LTVKGADAEVSAHAMRRTPPPAFGSIEIVSGSTGEASVVSFMKRAQNYYDGTVAIRCESTAPSGNIPRVLTDRFLQFTRRSPAVLESFSAMPGSKPRVVLLADEDDSIRNTLGKFLRLRGFEVVTAGTVAQALDAILTHRPSAAVIELLFEGGSGRDVIVSLPSRVPVIIFSSIPGESCELERLRPRTRLLAKPHSLVMVVETLEQMLEEVEVLP
jgi:CheY-like chemotaxis protein